MTREERAESFLKKAEEELRMEIHLDKDQRIKPNSSRKYDLWLDDIERQNWSKLFLEV